MIYYMPIFKINFTAGRGQGAVQIVQTRRGERQVDDAIKRPEQSGRSGVLIHAKGMRLLFA